jgi:hypothetical protein
MKQKIMVISVLMRRPEVIFLVEPTVGLDARSAKILKMLLEKYKGEGSTIFMTTHVLEIAEKMCDRIGIINKGKLISEGTLDELRRRAGATTKRLSRTSSCSLLARTKTSGNCRRIVRCLFERLKLFLKYKLFMFPGKKGTRGGLSGQLFVFACFTIHDRNVFSGTCMVRFWSSREGVSHWQGHGRIFSDNLRAVLS